MRDVVRGPFATVRTAIVDPYDIAAVAAAALLGDGPDGRIHEITGREPHTFEQHRPPRGTP